MTTVVKTKTITNRSVTKKLRFEAAPNVVSDPTEEPSSIVNTPTTNKVPTKNEPSAEKVPSPTAEQPVPPLEESARAADKPTKTATTQPAEDDNPGSSSTNNTQANVVVIQLPTTDMSLKCTECDYSNYRRSRFIKHCSDVHDKDVTVKYRCSGCDTDFEESQDCKNHVLTCAQMVNSLGEQPAAQEQPTATEQEEDQTQSEAPPNNEETAPKRSRTSKRLAPSAPGDTALPPLPAKRARRPTRSLPVESAPPRHVRHNRQSTVPKRRSAATTPQSVVAPSTQPIIAATARQTDVAPVAQQSAPAVLQPPHAEAPPSPVWETLFYAGVGRNFLGNTEAINQFAEMAQKQGAVEALTNVVPMFHQITGDVIKGLEEDSAAGDQLRRRSN